MHAIIEVMINGVVEEKPRYVRTFGKYAGWTDDIWKAKIYPTKNTARKAADRLEKHIVDFYNKGYTTYGWDYNPDGTAYPTTKQIYTIVHEVELKIINK